METKWNIGQKVLVEVEVAEIHIDAGSTKYILNGTAQKDGFKIMADESEIHSLDECQRSKETLMTKETIIKSALKYLVKMQIEEGSAGFAVDNDTDYDCCWDDVLAWLEVDKEE